MIAMSMQPNAAPIMYTLCSSDSTKGGDRTCSTPSIVALSGGYLILHRLLEVFVCFLVLWLIALLVLLVEVLLLLVFAMLVVRGALGVRIV